MPIDSNVITEIIGKDLESVSDKLSQEFPRK